MPDHFNQLLGHVPTMVNPNHVLFVLEKYPAFMLILKFPATTRAKFNKYQRLWLVLTTLSYLNLIRLKILEIIGWNLQ